MRTHTTSDGSFVDSKAEEIATAYEKQLAEVMDEPNGPDQSDNSSQQSTHRTLSITEKNEIFLKVVPLSCTLFNYVCLVLVPSFTVFFWCPSFELMS